jgi:hypothetical protein
MAGRGKTLTLLAAAAVAAGCGGGGDGAIEEPALRECLAEGGLQVEAAAPATSPTLGNASPDFRALIDDVAVDVIVVRDQERAQRTAADLRGALGTFGVTDVDALLLEERNVIAVFSQAPTPEQREAVASCLD